MEKVICVFCENIYEADTIVCPECEEYKGMMPLTLAKATYDFLNVED